MIPWVLIGGGLVALFAASRIARTVPPELAVLAITATGLDNDPPPAVWPELRRLARFVEGLRSKFGQVEIRSAYRSPEVNRAVDGVENSLHMQGRAVDFAFPGAPGELRELFTSWVAEPFRIAGLIEEAILTETEGRAPWLHVGLARAGLAPSPKLIKKTRSGGLEA